MNCPICETPLLQEQAYFICPRGHGSLLSGGQLDKLKDRPIAEANLSSTEPIKPKQLVCPHCGGSMAKVNYDDSEIFIDSCTQCPYRWLDAGEITKIRQYQPKLSPEDALYL